MGWRVKKAESGGWTRPLARDTENLSDWACLVSICNVMFKHRFMSGGSGDIGRGELAGRNWSLSWSLDVSCLFLIHTCLPTYQEVKKSLCSMLPPPDALSKHTG